MSQLIYRSRLALFTLILTVGVSGSAEAKIVIGKSIGGVRIGMTKNQVGRLLGRGKPQGHGSGVYTYRHGTFTVRFDHGAVNDVSTRSKRERTSKGVGVSTTLSQLKQRVPHLRCVLQRFFYGCYVKSSRHRWTLFFFNPSGGNRVTSVDLNNSGYM